MKPRSEHVEPLEEYDVTAFAAWLSSGFEDINHEEDKRRCTAFSPLNYFVGYEDDITSELKNIYDVLSSTAKNNFRNAIATALSHLPPEDSTAVIVRELLHLAGCLHATEVFPEIVKKVESGFFDLPDQEEGRRLFALSLDIVAGMAEDKGAADVVRCLVGSDFFHFGYAPMAFIALCRAEPNNYPDHLPLLRNDFADLHQETGTKSVHITVKRFAHYVTPKIIADNLWRLGITVKPGDEILSDNWLGKAMFVESDAPFTVDKVKENFQIRRRDRRKDEGNAWFKVHPYFPRDPNQKSWRSAHPLNMFLTHCIEHNGGSSIWGDIDFPQLDEKLQKTADQPHDKIAPMDVQVFSMQFDLGIKTTKPKQNSHHTKGDRHEQAFLQ